MAKKLSNAHLILLAVAYASDSNIPGLQALFLHEPGLFRLELALRILLTFLPESLDPEAYSPLLELLLDTQTDENGGRAANESANFDRSPVEQLSASEAKKNLKNLRLKRLRPAKIKSPKDAILHQAPDEPLVLFLIQRAHIIERETGMLTLVPVLIEPFNDRYSFLKSWYVSSVLPLLRFDYEYYQEEGFPTELETFESYEGAAGVQVLMSRSTFASREGTSSAETVGRDLRGTVGPWTFGSSQRKRRKLRNPTSLENRNGPRHAQAENGTDEQVSLQLDPRDQLEDWQHAFKWMVTSAVDNFDLVVQIVEGWRGPNDVDLGDIDLSSVANTDDQVQSQLHLQYCQAALATVYATDSDHPQTIEGSHRILVQVAEMMGYPSPPSLGIDVNLLPSLEQLIGEPAQPLERYTQQYLQFNELLKSQQLLTLPTLEAFALLVLLVHSTSILTGLGYTGSVAQVAKLCFYGDQADSNRLLQKMLEQLSNLSQTTEQRWDTVRQEMLWLRDWNSSGDVLEDSTSEQGVFRKLSRLALERQILEAIGRGGHLRLLRDTYLKSDQSTNPLPYDLVEQSLIDLFHENYAAATNGNKTRSSMKKAADLLTTFHPQFKSSEKFRQAAALLSATHALSFYTLTLDPGQPTPPVRIRDHLEPLSLIRIVLSQNPRSYTKLDDLVSIAKNLVIANPEAFLLDASVDPYSNPLLQLGRNEQARVIHSTRLVTGMAIDAALAEDDFETAYSYVVNRLSLSSPSQSQSEAIPDLGLPDDTSWRAAYQAGKHRTILPQDAPNHERTRRLEQRMDLLSRALSLGPEQSLTEILAAWRRCEEELLTLLQDEDDAEAEADAIADKRLSARMSGSQELPGAFSGEQPALVHGQPRRKEVGRAHRADGEAPMGLFDVARGAAEAFGRMGQKQMSAARAQRGPEQLEESEEDSYERVRKRDMVANAVTGGMAKGLGWVLGATPNQ